MTLKRHSINFPKMFDLLSVFAATLLIASCATSNFNPFGQKSTNITGAVIASETLNQRSDGLSTSVVVRLYQLKSPTEFTQTDFFTLYEQGDTALGPDALIKELVVLPNTTSVLDNIELADESLYVGVLAAFRDWKNANWTAVLEIPANKSTILNIQVTNSDVSVTKGKRGWLRHIRKESKKMPKDL